MAKHIIFTGRVQGIGFRFTVLSIANRGQLAGLVRNLPDGSVEMIAQGHSEDIDTCIRQIKDSYPDTVRDVTIEDAEYNPGYKDFKITF